MRKLIYCAVFVLFAQTASSEILSESMHQRLIDIAFDNFWGKAKLSDGSLAQPSSDIERVMVPISTDDAAKVIQIAELSAIAKWCALPWSNNYKHITNSARQFTLSDKQVAFVGFLHGVAMGVVQQSLQGKTCSEQLQQTTQQKLTERQKLSVNFAASSVSIPKK